MRMLRCLCLILACVAGPGLAQENQGTAVLRSPILTIDPEGLFAQTTFGQRVSQDMVQRSENLAAENRRIESALTQEEQSLAERRPSMDPSVFRAEADVFDTKVQGIRTAQDAKERELQQILSSEQDAFLAAIQPVLGAIMVEYGAVVVVDRRSVFLSAGLVDITDLAVARIDQTLGDGGETLGTDPETPETIPSEN